MVARSRPNLVILDVEMPGMSGVQVLKSLRAVDPTIPVIVLTATKDASVAAETLKQGGCLLRQALDLRYLDHLVATFAMKPRLKGSGARALPRLRVRPSPPQRCRRCFHEPHGVAKAPALGHQAPSFFLVTALS